MINYDNIGLTARYKGKKAVSAVYLGLKLIWEAISSCFGSGIWIRERPWSRTDCWKRNV